MKKWLYSLAGLFVTISCFFLPVASASQPIKIGIAPQGQNSLALAESWIPFIQVLENESGLAIQFATAPDLLEFSRRVEEGDYDLIVTSRYLYTILDQKYSLNNIAELANLDEQPGLALITPVHVNDVKKLSGALLAIKQDEDSLKLQALNDFLTQKNITAVRDTLSSYEKILQSVSEELHLAGLVPVNRVKPYESRLNILWQTKSNDPYLLSATASLTPTEKDNLLHSLSKLQFPIKPNKTTRISVKSVVELPSESNGFTNSEDRSGAVN